MRAKQSNPPNFTTTDMNEPDDREPTPDRQDEFKAAYEANVAAGKAPYEGVAFRTRGELHWVLRERRWTAEYDPQDRQHANLSGASFFGVNLRGVQLRYANLRGAFLFRANLSGADLWRADLSGAYLDAVNLNSANLSRARMDAATDLTLAKLDSRSRLGDIVWNGVPITRLNWEEIATLGDEYRAWQARDEHGRPKDKETRLRHFKNAVMANRQVATQLHTQGLNEQADRFAYRAQVLQRQVLRRQRHWVRWLGSVLLDMVAGYGYKPIRSIFTYLLVVIVFAAVYFGLGGAHGQPLSVNESVVVSLTAFHGRGFFATAFQPGDPQAAVAAIEAIIGLLIEISFIATFTNRFFNSR